MEIGPVQLVQQLCMVEEAKLYAWEAVLRRPVEAASVAMCKVKGCCEEAYRSSGGLSAAYRCPGLTGGLWGIDSSLLSWEEQLQHLLACSK